jgi:hypothetical protein
MDVDVDEHRCAIDNERPGEPCVEAGLLAGLAQGCLPRGLAGVDVASRLDPDSQPLVLVEQHTARADDNPRCGHVHRIGIDVERGVEHVVQVEESGDRVGLALVDGSPRGDV